MNPRLKFLAVLLCLTCMNIACDDDAKETDQTGGTPAGSQGGTPAGAEGGTPAGSQGGTPAGSEGGIPAGSEGGIPAGSEGGIPAGSEGGTPAGSQVSLETASLVGNWRSETCESYPDGNGGNNYLTRHFYLTEDQWSLFVTIYTDDQCQTAGFSFDIDGTYTLEQNSATEAGAVEANFKITRNDWVAHQSFFNDLFGNSACGSQPWVLNQKQSVLETGCIGVAKPESACPGGELDLLLLDGDSLYFGERSVDLCSERAPRIGSYPVKRQSNTLKAPISPIDLIGTWSSSQCEAYPAGDGSTNYLDKQFGLGVDTWSIFGTIYGDDKCTAPLFSFDIKGTYQVQGGRSDESTWSEAQFKIHQNNWTAYTEAFAGIFDMSGCGSRIWVVNEPQSVLESGCIGVAMPEADCINGEQDLLKLDGNALYFGQRSVNLCNERAPTLNGYAVYRTPAQISFEQADLYPEGIAQKDYQSFYVSSVGSGRIVKAQLDGNHQELVSAFALGGSTLGLKYAGGFLWSCVSNTQNPSVSGLAKLNPEDGSQVAFYTLPSAGFCNDLVADASGNVYVTESFSGIIYQLKAGTETLVEWLSGPQFAPDPAAGYSFNGIALSQDGSALLVGRADTGVIVKVEITATGEAGMTSVEAFADQTAIFGIDGMTRWRGELFVVRGFGVYRVIESTSPWTLAEVVRPLTLSFPTAVAVDHFGNAWVVESQLNALLDGDETTNGTLPFKVVRVPLRTDLY
jgi:sugar lactone lactonase YvrE